MSDDPRGDPPDAVDMDATDRLPAIAADDVPDDARLLVDDDPVRSLLDELDVHGSVAALDMRLVDVEQRLRKIAERVDLAGRRQAGELDVMRARITDLLDLLSGEGAPAVPLPGVASGNAGATAVETSTAPDETAATLADERIRELLDQLEDLRDDVRARTTDALGEIEGSLAAVRGEFSGALDDEASQRRIDLDELEKRLNGRVDVAAEADSEARRRLDDRIEALRRELDAASGELRAHVAVALGDITDRMDQLAGQGPESRPLGPSDDDTVVLRAVPDSEVRAAVREQGVDRNEVATTLAAVTARMDVLQSTLAHAVNDIASSLGKRVTTLATQVSDVQEASSRQRQREPDHESLVARLALLEERVEDTSAQRAVADQLGQLQRELARIAGRLDSFARQAVAADERAEALRRDLGVLGDEVATAGAWRSELRDLTTRTTELAARVAEAETVARRAGNAVIEALRQVRADAELGD